MAASCLFGILVFNSDFRLIYRFLTDDLFLNLYKICQHKSDEDNDENEETDLPIDDKIGHHFSPLIQVYVQTCSRNSPLKRVTLESNVQVFFDQIGTNKILCMADESFNTLVVLKTINLFKSLIKFHIGAFPFTQCRTVNKLIDRISASLQYYLNNITTNQSLLFESFEYLHINSLIRQQCIDACTNINPNSQLSSAIILITCKDKIVHMQLSNEQNRPSNSDIFLLLLNNTSQSLRTQFQLQQNNSSSTIAHTYKTKIDNDIHQNLTNLTTNMRGSGTMSTDDMNHAQARRAFSLPVFTRIEATQMNDNESIEVVFMKTSTKTLAPFTMCTIPLTNDISVIVLTEWKNSLACTILSELIGQFNLCLSQLQLFSYKKLKNQIRTVESNITVRRYFESKGYVSNILLTILHETQSIYRSLTNGTNVIDGDNHTGINQFETRLKRMSNISINAFEKAFLSSNDNDNFIISSTNEKHVLDSSIILSLQTKLLKQLGDWFSFIETKSQGNITISFCQRDFPGLVHFALIDRSRGRICTPVLFNDEYKDYLTTNINPNETEHIKEKKIIDFELECLSALQRGCTSYTMTDEYFTYNYTLRLQESNGASMRLYKPFVKSEPPGILHYDFYEKLAYENYASLIDQTPIACFELICVHLRFVPSNVVREHCEQLWPTLMELDE